MAINKTWTLQGYDGTEIVLAEFSLDMGGVSLHVSNAHWYNQQQLGSIISTLQTAFNEMQANGIGA